MAPVAPIVMAIGTGISMLGSLRQGREAEEIARERAAIDIANADAARRRSVEEARIKKERGRRLIEEQKGAAAAGGIRLNVGAPLVIETQTRADIAKDMGYILERGREEEGYYRSRARWELARGKAARKRSKWEAITRGLTGFGNIAYMGTEAGMWG